MDFNITQRHAPQCLYTMIWGKSQQTHTSHNYIRVWPISEMGFVDASEHIC